MMVGVGFFSYKCTVSNEEIPFYSKISGLFLKKSWITDEFSQMFFFFFLLIYWIILIGSWMLTQPCILGVHSIWSWYVLYIAGFN